MGATLLSVLFLIGLIIFNGVPLVVAIGAARSNHRYGKGTTTNVVFWVLTGVYLGWVGLIGLFLISTVSQPQQEGLAAFSGMAMLSVIGLPGSVIPATTASFVADGTLVRPFGLSSMSAWLVIGILCWQFFLIVGIRWLIQLQPRGRTRVSAVGVGEPPASLIRKP